MTSTNVSISLYRDNITNKLNPDYIPSSGFTFSGVKQHGSILTITDSESRFNIRTNIKPLFVNLGNSLAGSNLGRDTSSPFNTSMTIDPTFKKGSLSSSVKIDLKADATAGMFVSPVITEDQDQPLIQYIERSYNFSFDDPRIQNNVYTITQWNFANTNSIQIIINARPYTVVNDGTAGSINNREAVVNAFVSLINADYACECTASNASGNLVLTKKVLTDYFDVTYTNMYQNFNNKAVRIWSHNNISNNNVYLITSSQTSSRTSVENTSGSISTPYYDAHPEDTAFMCEELIFKNSSAGGISDGFYNHYKNGELLNVGNSLVTYDVGEDKLGRCYLNQMSNGPYGYWKDELSLSFGYQCWDDEYDGIYLCSDEIITPGVTKLVRQPQQTWSEGQVTIHLIETHVPIIGAYVFLRTGLTQYTYLGQLL